MKCPIAMSMLAAAALGGCGGDSSNGAPATATTPAATVSHVLLISVDGLHEQDVAHCLAAGSCPNIAALAGTGVQYTSAATPGLSDSFPGLAAILTGGTPRSAGLFYDVSYDRTLYAPSDATCTGTQGWNVVFDETTGIDAFNGGALTHLDGGGAFNPQAIPHALVNGTCVPVYPHDYIKTNTLFEAVKANLAGARTAWADKHAWGYDWVNGPSGQGVDDLARTEINSTDAATGSDYTDVYTHTEKFDDLHVAIILNQIDGKSGSGTDLAPVPTVFGTNFQTLSVAQKATHAKGGGYTDAAFTPGVAVTAAMSYVDTSLGKFVAELKAKGVYSSTMIVLTAKHGQSPGDPALIVKHGDTLTALMEANGYLDAGGAFGQASTATGNLNDGSGLSGTGMIQTDDVGLIWLRDPSQTAAAVATINANLGCAAPGICADGTGASVLSGAALAARFGDPALGRAPDIIVQPNPGVIYTSSTTKDAEHGGNSPDDSHVALIVSYPAWAASTNATAVVTTQVAPTILTALKLDPTLLQAVKSEGTAALPGITF
jgi:Type I phosphodiesterase / nucleotide pyrophosphatase